MENFGGPNQTAISVLGTFELSVNGGRVDLALREMRLLALLTLQGVSPRDFVSGTLWPETIQERAAASLRVSVHNIRRAVPGLLEVTHHVIGLAGHVTNDLEILRECLTAEPAGPEEIDRSLAVLASGDLLAGWREDWVVHERERMRHRRIRALAALAQRCLDLGDPRTGLAAALAAERLEPLRERTHWLAVRAMMIMGLDDEALAHHRCFGDRLHQELGIRPPDRFVRLGVAG